MRKRRTFKASELRRLASAESFRDAREPPLRIGDFVRLNSGSPRMILVDCDRHDVVAAWRNENGAAEEGQFSRESVHREALI
jgi:uncharacterized protein YodC (DUF2158 family)